jgi:hypothetical protein
MRLVGPNGVRLLARRRERRAERRSAQQHAQVLEKKSSIYDLALQTSIPPGRESLRLFKSFSLPTATFATFLALIDPFCTQKSVRFEFVFLTLLLILQDLT